MRREVISTLQLTTQVVFFKELTEEEKKKAKNKRELNYVTRTYVSDPIRNIANNSNSSKQSLISAYESLSKNIEETISDSLDEGSGYVLTGYVSMVLKIVSKPDRISGRKWFDLKGNEGLIYGGTGGINPVNFDNNCLLWCIHLKQSDDNGKLPHNVNRNLESKPNQKALNVYLNKINLYVENFNNNNTEKQITPNNLSYEHYEEALGIKLEVYRNQYYMKNKGSENEEIKKKNELLYMNKKNYDDTFVNIEKNIIRVLKVTQGEWEVESILNPDLLLDKPQHYIWLKSFERYVGKQNSKFCYKCLKSFFATSNIVNGKKVNFPPADVLRRHQEEGNCG